MCLAKDPDERWQSAADLRRELQWIGQAHVESTASQRPTRTVWKWIAILSMLAVTGLATAIVIGLRGAAPQLRSSERFEIVLPDSAPLASAAGMPPAVNKTALALSSDGSRLAYVAQVGGHTQIFVREMATGAIRAIPGTEGGYSPFFSPRAESIAYFAQGRLLKAPIAGGMPVPLADAPNPWGGVWAPDGAIFFNRFEAERLFKIPEAGGISEAVSERTGLYAPALLPPGCGLLASNGAKIFIVKDGQEKELLDGFAPQYLQTGRLVYAAAGALMAVAFDPAPAQPIGSPVQLFTDFGTARTPWLSSPFPQRVPSCTSPVAMNWRARSCGPTSQAGSRPSAFRGSHMALSALPGTGGDSQQCGGVAAAPGVLTSGCTTWRARASLFV